jgi:hypothetical protein
MTEPFDLDLLNGEAELRRLGRQTLPEAPGVQFRQGVIQAATPPTATLQLGGSTTDIPGVPCLSSYTPVAGDTVCVLKNGPDLLIVGSVGPKAWTPYTPTLRSWDSNANLADGSIDARYLKVGRDVRFDVLIKCGASTTWGTGGGGIVGLLPVAPRRPHADATWSVMLQQAAAQWSLALAAYPSSTWHDIVATSGVGTQGAPGSGVQYQIRGSYESAS